MRENKKVLLAKKHNEKKAKVFLSGDNKICFHVSLSVVVIVVIVSGPERERKEETKIWGKTAHQH